MRTDPDDYSVNQLPEISGFHSIFLSKNLNNIDKIINIPGSDLYIMCNKNEIFTFNRDFNILFRYFLFETEKDNTIRQIIAYSLKDYILILFENSKKIYFYDVLKNNFDYYQDEENKGIVIKSLCYDGEFIFYIGFLDGYIFDSYVLIKLSEKKIVFKKEKDYVSDNLGVGCSPLRTMLFVYSTFLFFV